MLEKLIRIKLAMDPELSSTSTTANGVHMIYNDLGLPCTCSSRAAFNENRMLLLLQDNPEIERIKALSLQRMFVAFIEDHYGGRSGRIPSVEISALQSRFLGPDWSNRIQRCEFTKGVRLNYLETLISDPDYGDRHLPKFVLNGCYALFVLLTETARVPKMLDLVFWPMGVLPEGSTMRTDKSWWKRALSEVRQISFGTYSLNARIIKDVFNFAPYLHEIMLSVMSIPIQSLGGQSTTYRNLFASIDTLALSLNMPVTELARLAQLLAGTQQSEFTRSVSQFEGWMRGNLKNFFFNSEECIFYTKKTNNVDGLVEIYILPFIIGNLSQLKHLDIFGIILDNKYWKRICRHKEFKNLKLDALGLSIYLRNSKDPSIIWNFDQVLHFVKSQTRLKSILATVNEWNCERQDLRQIFNCLPNLHTICIRKVERFLDGTSLRLNREKIRSLNDIIPNIPKSLHTLKVLIMSNEPQKYEPREMHSHNADFSASVDEEFMKKLPALKCLMFYNVQIETGHTLLPLLEKSKLTLTLLLIKTGCHVVTNSIFRRIMTDLPMLKSFHLFNSVISDTALVKNSPPPEKIDDKTSSIFSSMENLRELSLICCPWVTATGFSTIKGPNLLRINLSRNQNIDGRAIRAIYRNNPSIDDIVVDACRLLSPTLVMSIERTANIHERRVITIEADHVIQLKLPLCEQLISESLGAEPGSSLTAFHSEFVRYKYNCVSTEDLIPEDEMDFPCSELHRMTKRMRVLSVSNLLLQHQSCEWKQVPIPILAENIILGALAFENFVKIPYRFPITSWSREIKTPPMSLTSRAASRFPTIQIIEC